MGRRARSATNIDHDSAERASECLRTLAHPHRLMMVGMLLGGRHRVGDLAEACEIAPNTASTHLRLMKDRGLLTLERDGREVFYSVSEPALKSIMRCVCKRYGDGAQK